MEKKRALYAGTFDPFTNGHLDIVQRAIKMFDEIIILVAVSPNKKPFMSNDQRVNVLKKLLSDEKLRCLMGVNARINVVKNWTWEKSIERFLEIIRKWQKI